MSEADHQVIRDMYAAFNDSGVEAMLPYVDPAAELITPTELSSEPGTWKGHEGLRAYFASFYEAMDEIRVEPENFEDVGGWVVVDLKVAFKGKSSGIEAEQMIPSRLRLSDGKVTLNTFEQTREETIAAAKADGS